MSSGTAKTAYNTLDDGSGNASITGSLTVGGNLNVTGTINGSSANSSSGAVSVFSTNVSVNTLLNGSNAVIGKVNVVASSNSYETATLPTAVNGGVLTIVNTGTHTLSVSPVVGGSVSIATGQFTWFYAYNNAWYYTV